MSSALAIVDTKLDAIEQALVTGNIGALNQADRLAYYDKLCKSLGLNPLTQPFEYLTLNNKVRLYAKKDCTDQLRSINGVSVTKLEKERIEDVYAVTAYVQDAKGRVDSAVGAVTVGSLKGEALANALMKAETKAKRRATLSICGLGFLDETEIETIPAHQMDNVTLPAAEASKPIIEGFVSDIAQVKDSWFYKVDAETCTTNNEKFAKKLAGSHGLKVKLEVHSQKLQDKAYVIINVLDVQIPEDLTPLLAASIERVKTDAQAASDLFAAAEAQASEFIDDETGTAKGIVKNLRQPTEKSKALFVEIVSANGTVASLSTFSKSLMKRLDHAENKAVILRFKRSDCGKYMNITDVERVGEVDFTEGA
jgi:hypothetical protein